MQEQPAIVFLQVGGPIGPGWRFGRPVCSEKYHQDKRRSSATAPAPAALEPPKGLGFGLGPKLGLRLGLGRWSC